MTLHHHFDGFLFLISTHTSRVGCDSYAEIICFCRFQFLLTHPVWDVTNNTGVNLYFFEISTHTSRVGCDHSMMSVVLIPTVFLLTHPVWDVTCRKALFCFLSLPFLLTHPVWDVTKLVPGSFLIGLISTHTSRVGCDHQSSNRHLLTNYFYSHIPCGK